MTIELVAMLFDFVFETRDLPDGIKALLARLQIPVLKAAMLDGAFFAKKSHPARLLINALAQAGLGWSPAMGQEDPLYKKIDEIVHKILDGFTDNLAIFDELRDDLERYLAEEEKAAEANIQSTAEEINQNDRRTIATGVAKAEIERRIEAVPGAQLPRDVPAHAVARRARARVPPARRGERGLVASRRDARGPGVERSAQEARTKTAGTWSRCCRRC